MSDLICGRIAAGEKYNSTRDILGTVRHQGFIPWDDDVDVSMFRKDYEKLKEIVRSQMQYPLQFEDAYDGYKLNFMSKIRNAETTAIQDFSFPEECNQGIFIDIYPLDDAGDGLEGDETVAKVREIWKTVTDPAAIIRGIQSGYPFHMDIQVLSRLCEEKTLVRFRYLEDFLCENNGKSRKINFIYDEMAMDNRGLERSWYEDTVWLPFEDRMMPVPGNYMEVLTHRYGDYSVMVKNASAHVGTVMDAEKPYREYLRICKDRGHILF